MEAAEVEVEVEAEAEAEAEETGHRLLRQAAAVVLEAVVERVEAVVVKGLLPEVLGGVDQDPSRVVKEEEARA